MMIPVSITYFDVSAEIDWNNQMGHMVRVAYTANIPQSIVDSEFDLIENVSFRLEWKGLVGNIETLIYNREMKAFPNERISISSAGTIVRTRQAFLSREFLKWERDFPEMAELFSHISLIPILTTTRHSVPIERINGRYRLIPGQIGNPPSTNTVGFEY